MKKPYYIFNCGCEHEIIPGSKKYKKYKKTASSPIGGKIVCTEHEQPIQKVVITCAVCGTKRYLKKYSPKITLCLVCKKEKIRQEVLAAKKESKAISSSGCYSIEDEVNFIRNMKSLKALENYQKQIINNVKYLWSKERRYRAIAACNQRLGNV